MYSHSALFVRQARFCRAGAAALAAVTIPALMAPASSAALTDHSVATRPGKIQVVDGRERPRSAQDAPTNEAEVERVTRDVVSNRADARWQALQAISIDAVTMTGDSEPVALTSLDLAAGKVEVVVRRYDVSLHAQLASRFKGEDVYLRVDSSLPEFTPLVGSGAEPAVPAATQPGTRQSDYHPWSGGARYRFKNGECTTGFPWVIGLKKYMITAGHCLPNGGWTWSNVNTELLGGIVRKDKDENWDAKKGTQIILRQGGDKERNGDLARIPVQSATSIYVGSPTSTAIKQVSGTNFTFPGSQVCTGGSFSGELCGWRVTRTFAIVTYSSTQAKAHNVALAEKNDGHCLAPGDSGGPVYTPHVSNSVHAHGIISGGADNGLNCELIFTDIWRAVDLWSGQLNVKRYF